MIWNIRPILHVESAAGLLLTFEVFNQFLTGSGPKWTVQTRKVGGPITEDSILAAKFPGAVPHKT